MKVKYSICTPVYNAEKYLDQCINSVLDQDFFEYELILVDDHSNDKSGFKCDEYAKKDNRIKVIHNSESKGSLYSRDVAIKKAKGDYLMFLDSDDYYEPKTLTIIDGYLLNNEYDLLMFGNNRIVNGNVESSFSENRIIMYNEQNKRDFLLKVVFDSNYKVLWNKVVKANLLKDINVPQEDYNIKRGTDKYLSIDIHSSVKNVIFIPNILYNYRILESGITGKQKKDYTLNYRNRIKLKDKVYSDSCLTKQDLNLFDKFEYKEFRSQISRISNLETTKQKKIELFEKIKQEEYYLNYIDKLISNYGEDYIIWLFRKSKYKTLIFVANIKNKILSLVKG